MRPQAPLRECDHGCGRKRRTWRSPFVCASCIRVMAATRDDPATESLQDFRRRLQGAPAESAGHDV